MSVNGGPFTLLQDWSPTNTWTLPGTSPQGSYYILGEVRTSSAVYRDAFAAMTYSISAAIPATGVTLTSSVPSPQAPGTDVVFTATGLGSSGYQYRFRMSANGGPFTLLQDWSATNTWTLPGTSPLGSYYILAEVRTSSFVYRDAYAATTYSISAAIPATGVTLTPSVTPSPYTQGTVVVFTAAGQGSSGYEYRFRMSLNGGPFTVLQDWSATDNWTLPANAVLGTYYLLAEVRTSSFVTRDAWASRGFDVIP
jgi:hypothetical protein